MDLSTSSLWVWQSPSWPRFTYDAVATANAVAQARFEQGKLLGKASAVGAGGLSSTKLDIWTGEALATSAIEGEQLNVDAVRSSVARRLSITSFATIAVPRGVEGLLDVMEDATAKWTTELTEERLCGWQRALFPDGYSSLRKIEVGRYRSHAKPMQIVSGPIGRESVHYEAPPSNAVRAEMRNFLDWLNRTREAMPDGTLDGLVRAGLAHLWFETVHPFEDGNGRVGRAVVDMALAQDARFRYRLHGLSAEFQRQQANYYAALNQAQRGSGDATAWLLWFVDAFRVSCQFTSVLIDEALDRARFWSEHKDVSLNERQRKILNKLLEAGPGRFEGGMTARKYQALTGTSGATATRELADLALKGLLVPRGGGRSTYYDLTMPGWGWAPKLARSRPG